MMIRNGRPIFFKTKKASDYQKIIRHYACHFKPKKPWGGPIHMSVAYYIERPNSLNTKKFSGRAIRHTKRPDLDNLQKGTQDALRDFWIDDSQICSLAITKYYCAKGESPRIHFVIIKADEERIW